LDFDGGEAPEVRKIEDFCGVYLGHGSEEPVPS
jgi:hypothetical protein